MASQSPSAPADESLSIRIVREIATREGVDPTELSPPLHHSVDPTALEALFESTATGGLRSGRITFTCAGNRVTVDGDGEIAIDSTAATESGGSR